MFLKKIKKFYAIMVMFIGFFVFTNSFAEVGFFDLGLSESENNLLVRFNNKKILENGTIEVLLDYNEVANDTLYLCEKLPKNNWKGIIGVSSGGLMATMIVANKLSVYNIEVIAAKSYALDRSQSDIKLVNFFDFSNKEDGEGWLVVDDMVDSGKTINWIKTKLPKAYYAVVYARPNSLNYVDAYAYVLPNKAWILFPWMEEVLNESKRI